MLVYASHRYAMAQRQGRTDVSHNAGVGDVGILRRIVAAKRRRIEADKVAISQDSMIRAAQEVTASNPPMVFYDVLAADDSISVIAEMKRSSPSAGEMDLSLDPIDRAATYCNAGAAAISVLTEQDFFQGDIQDLRNAASVAHQHDVAVLEKDFVVDEYQIHQARAAGADTVLLIIAILDPSQYADLYAVSKASGMEPLVEVFDEQELETALTSAEPGIVGVNNRNLKTLQTSLDVFPRLARMIPDDVIKVAESGMRNSDDVRRMADSGARAVLVGESLMTGGDPSSLISEMSSIIM